MCSTVASDEKNTPPKKKQPPKQNNNKQTKKREEARAAQSEYTHSETRVALKTGQETLKLSSQAHIKDMAFKGLLEWVGFSL